MYPSVWHHEQTGACGPRLVEPLALKKRYQVQWRRPSLDLVKLAKFKNLGWSNARLAKHFDRSAATIEWWFHTFRREPKKYRDALLALGE